MKKLDLEREELPRLLAPKSGLRGIELGVALGDYSARLWQSGRFKELWGVDAYADPHATDEYIFALKHIGFDANYRLHRMYFSEALSVFPDRYFDFIYIDGYAHTGEEAGRTLYDWYAKLRVGGMIAGHDYHEDWPLVVHSVNRFVADTGMSLMLTRLTSNAGPQDRHPSWAAIRSSDEDVTYPAELGKIRSRTLFKGKRRRIKKQPEFNMHPMHGIHASRSPLRRFKRHKRASSIVTITSEKKQSIEAIQRSKSGMRCLIVGSAPSINALDLRFVNDCDIFALNRAAEVCASLDVSQKFVVIADPLVMNDYGHQLPFSAFDIFFASTKISDICHDHILYFDLYKKPSNYDGFAQKDLKKPLYTCHTVASVAVQIAVAMGYSEIYLAGIDLNFPEDEPHFYKSSVRERLSSQKISRRKSSLMRAGLAYLAYWAEQQGSQVINLSPEKSLPLIPAKDFDAVFPPKT